jgi:hypothetical protein
MGRKVGWGAFGVDRKAKNLQKWQEKYRIGGKAVELLEIEKVKISRSQCRILFYLKKSKFWLLIFLWLFLVGMLYKMTLLYITLHKLHYSTSVQGAWHTGSHIVNCYVNIIDHISIQTKGRSTYSCLY